MTPPAAEEPARGPHHHPDLVHDLHDVHVVDHNGRQISGGSWVCCMPCYWLRTNTSLHKASLTVVTLLVTSLLVASPVLFLISSVPANEQPYKDCATIEEEDCFVEKDLDAPISVCETLECKDIARRMQFSLSWNYDPCKDFYKFACGSWLESHKLKIQRLPVYGVDLSFSYIQKTIQLQIQQLLSFNATTGRFSKLGQFYSSCLSSFNQPVNLSPMYNILEKLGGYLPPGSLGPNDITFLVTNILKANGAPLFDLYLDRDVKNKSIYAIIIDLPRNFLSNQRTFMYNSGAHGYSNLKKQLFRYKRQDTKQDEYYNLLKDKYMEKKVFGITTVVEGMLPKGMKISDRQADVQEIAVFTTEADRLIPSKKELREQLHDPLNSEPYSIESLQESFPFVTWKTLLNDLLDEEENSGRNIYVISRQYLRSVTEMIAHFQKNSRHRVIQNGLLAMFARDFLYVIANHTAANEQRENFCTHMTIQSFSQPVSALYLSQYSKSYLDGLHGRVAQMFIELKKGLLSRVDKVSWLDSETKWKAMDKLAAMNAHFIAWPPLRNSTFVDQLISELTISSDFFENIVLRYAQIKHAQMKFKDKNIVNLSWPYPFVVNAFYETDDNSIVVPLALLTQPHFSRAVPDYINYGTIGNVIAHEMLHALDFSAVPYIPSLLWAKSSSLPALKTRLNCLATQYQAAAFKRVIKVKGANMKVEFDGNATREENAADIGGARVAWVAWRKIVGTTGGGLALANLPMTPAKLFFLAMAQLYCTDMSAESYIVAVENDFHMTAPERVNGLVRNSAAFAEVYQCPPNSPMNPSNKCVIW